MVLSQAFSTSRKPLICRSRTNQGRTRICFAKRKINLSTAFAGQTVGIREVADQIWVVSFMHYDLGFFDNEKGRVEPAPNPFTPEKVLTMSPE